MSELTIMNALNTLTPMAGVDNVAKNVLNLLVTIGGIAVACFLIWSIIKNALEFAKGQGSVSIWAILGKVLFLILCIGLIMTAKNWELIGSKGESIGNAIIDGASDTLSSVGK